MTIRYRDDGTPKKFEAGYGKPPKRNQFRKGQSGNPSGRPHLQPPDAEAIFRDYLLGEVSVREGEKTSRMPRLMYLLRRCETKNDFPSIVRLISLCRAAPFLQVPASDPDGKTARQRLDEDLDKLQARMEADQRGDTPPDEESDDSDERESH